MSLIMRFLSIVVCFSLLILSPGFLVTAQAAPPAQAPTPTPADASLIDQLQRATGGRASIAYHAQTGRVRFIGTDLAHPIPQGGDPPEQAARRFLETYGPLFGLTDQAQELTVMRVTSADRGRSFVRFQQVYQGIPVVGGELIVQMDAEKNVISAGGEILPGLKVNTTPRLEASTARELARGLVTKYYDLNAGDLTVSQPELWIYSPILLGPSFNLSALVWRMEVTPVELQPVRELVLIDAHTGAVALHFNQIDVARNRVIYDNNNDWTAGLPGTGPVRTEGGPATGVPDADDAYDYGGDTYDFYYNTHDRDSLDNAGMTLTQTVRYCPDAGSCPFANAFWNGQQMVYGEGYAAADDVVAHEMTHGVTEYASHLFYYMQSGAVNEAFSDIWGEFVDLTNGAGSDMPADRWQMGEDLPIGAIRDMSNPPAHGDPDRMGSTYYYCGEGDNGGVHTNMGVGSKAAYLMVDGDIFNGYTVAGIGIDKTAKIFYEVQANMFTSAADYNDLYNGLQQACTNLIGTSGITAADCQEVKDAVDATEMNLQPSSCQATESSICPIGQSPNNLFFDDMENTASGNWAHAALVGVDEWYYPQTANPYGFDATYATSGVYNLWGYNQPSVADYYIAMTSDVALPAGSTPYLHFNHAYAFEDYATTMYDGGVIEYSTDGGTSWQDAGSLITHNGYRGTIYTGYGNPLGGRQAFGQESNGYISSRLNLSMLAGENVRFRFRIGTDSSADAYGWFIDDFRICTCEIPPSLSIAKVDNPDPVQAGGLLTYTLTIANSGAGAASSLVITDTLPADTGFVSASDGGTLAAGNVVSWTVSSLAGGASITRTFAVTISSLAAGQVITNTTYGVRCDQVPTVTWGTAVTTTVIPPPCLCIYKAGEPGPILAGSLLTYTLTITNSGPSPASNLVITDAVPANTSFDSASDGGTESDGIVTWNVASLPSGASINRVFTVTISSLAGGQAIVNTICGVCCEQVPTPVWGPAVTTMVMPPLSLDISKSDSPDPVAPGGVLNYTIVLTATSGATTGGLADGWAGPGQVSEQQTVPTIPTIPEYNVQVTDTVPANSTCCASIGQGGTFISATNTVAWSGLEISPTESITLTFAITVDKNAAPGTLITNDDYGAVITNVVGVTPTMGSPVTTTVRQPSVNLPLIRK